MKSTIEAGKTYSTVAGALATVLEVFVNREGIAYQLVGKVAGNAGLVSWDGAGKHIQHLHHSINYDLMLGDAGGTWEYEPILAGHEYTTVGGNIISISHIDTNPANKYPVIGSYDLGEGGPAGSWTLRGVCNTNFPESRHNLNLKRKNRPVSIVAPTMQTRIVVGQMYYTMSGEHVLITKIDAEGDGHLYPVVGKSTWHNTYQKRRWTLEGVYDIGGSSNEDDLRLTPRMPTPSKMSELDNAHADMLRSIKNTVTKLKYESASLRAATDALSAQASKLEELCAANGN